MFLFPRCNNLNDSCCLRVVWGSIMPIPQDKKRPKLSAPAGQMYQLWLQDFYRGRPAGEELLSEDESLTELLLFAQEQIDEGAWDDIDTRKVLLRRVETMEFNFDAWLNTPFLKEDRIHKEIGKARPAKAVRKKK